MDAARRRNVSYLNNWGLTQKVLLAFVTRHCLAHLRLEIRLSRFTLLLYLESKTWKTRSLGVSRHPSILFGPNPPPGLVSNSSQRSPHLPIKFYAGNHEDHHHESCAEFPSSTPLSRPLRLVHCSGLHSFFSRTQHILYPACQCLDTWVGTSESARR
ncbi:hypothetical protein E2C01_015672 [Portunus trituberculatus]|uniref:Uncharacterized protein n=1 Tax=Portunus trituberculatus TaxID=210409 RepID=A0A5B7DM66_PORTR|nr:hypothetical protein [Portunus trituberculatus]